MALPAETLGAGFLRLDTRIAGDVFQKFVNYHIGCAIVGDISDALAASSALRNFVGETNGGGSIWFVADLGELQGRLEVRAALAGAERPVRP